MQSNRLGNGNKRTEVVEERKDLPIGNSKRRTELDRRKHLLAEMGIKNPMEISDSKSVLTIDAGQGASQIDTYATVPQGSTFDGVFVKLEQTKSTAARLEGPDVKKQKTVPARTMAGAFGFHAANNGSMNLAGTDYTHSELDRETGEVVLSRMTAGKKKGDVVLEQRRLRPSAGAAIEGSMLTTLPPKVALRNFPEGYAPEP